jgi:hypothetical protein
MWASQYSVAGPVARAVESCSPGSTALRRRGAAEVLAGMLDLQASVRLAHCVSAPEPQRAEGAWRAPLLLGDYVQKRLGAIDEATSRRLGRPFDGARIRVSDPVQLAAQLLSSDARESPESARAFALTTWRAHREYLLSNISRARADVAALREEVAADLREASPRGAKLEALDAVVRAAMSDAVPALCQRLAAVMEAPFVQGLTKATLSLPSLMDATTLAPWFTERGVLGAHLARTTELTRALLARDARAVETLVDAACSPSGQERA